MEPLFHHQLKHVPRCHNVFLGDLFPYRYDREDARPLLDFVVQKDAPAAGTDKGRHGPWQVHRSGMDYSQVATLGKGGGGVGRGGGVAVRAVAEVDVDAVEGEVADGDGEEGAGGEGDEGEACLGGCEVVGGEEDVREGGGHDVVDVVGGGRR